MVEGRALDPRSPSNGKTARASLIGARSATDRSIVAVMRALREKETRNGGRASAIAANLSATELPRIPIDHIRLPMEEFSGFLRIIVRANNAPLPRFLPSFNPAS